MSRLSNSDKMCVENVFSNNHAPTDRQMVIEFHAAKVSRSIGVIPSPVKGRSVKVVTHKGKRTRVIKY